MAILITGGAGYIGSHIYIELLNAGYDIVVVDNLSNSKYESLKRVSELTGKELKIYQIDILDGNKLVDVFNENIIEAVIHLQA